MVCDTGDPVVAWAGDPEGNVIVGTVIVEIEDYPRSGGSLNPSATDDLENTAMIDGDGFNVA